MLQQPSLNGVWGQGGKAGVHAQQRRYFRGCVLIVEVKLPDLFELALTVPYE